MSDPHGGALPISGLAFSLAGPGRVGTSLAAWLEACGARRVATAGRRGLADLATAGQDLLLVAVPDPSLAEVAAMLARRPQAAVALHTSGSLDASALSPLRAGGTAAGSLHPLKAFPRVLPDLAQAHGVFFAVDGDEPARALAHRIAAAWGAVSAEVEPEARPLYHFAATLAAGGVITLLALAADLAHRLGLPAAAVEGYLELSRGALEQARETGEPAAVLTGPAARGDRRTVALQLEALSRLMPERLPLVRALLQETLRQKERTGELGEEQRRLLDDLLDPPVRHEPEDGHRDVERAGHLRTPEG